MTTSDEIERRQWTAFIEQTFTDAVMSRASEILFRVEKERVKLFFLIDGKYEKSIAVPLSCWETVHHILTTEYFKNGIYEGYHQGMVVTYEWMEDSFGTIRINISKRTIKFQSEDFIGDVFRSFEDRSWDSIKSIFFSILNFALEQQYNGIVMELDGSVVDIGYYKDGIQRTILTISSDVYDALSRLIGENYFAFGFMTREFRDKEYLLRLVELNEDVIAPRIKLEIEELS